MAGVARLQSLCFCACASDTSAGAASVGPGRGTGDRTLAGAMAGAMPDPVFRAALRSADGDVNVELVGELDVSTADELRRHVDEIVAADGDVFVDCSELTFADSSGLDTLIRLAQTLREQERRLVLSNVRPIVRRAIDVLQISDLVELE